MNSQHPRPTVHNQGSAFIHSATLPSCVVPGGGIMAITPLQTAEASCSHPARQMWGDGSRLEQWQSWDS